MLRGAQAVLAAICIVAGGGGARAAAQAPGGSAPSGASQDAGPRKVVRSSDDLPRYTYLITSSAADVLTSSPERFEAVAAPVVADIDRTLAAYDLQDKATLRAMLKAKLGAEIASGRQDDAALATVAAIRSQEEKAGPRVESGLVYQAFLEARSRTHDAPGRCPAGFSAAYARHVEALPWGVVGTHVKLEKGLGQVATPAFITGFVSDLQPNLDRSHALAGDGAWRLLGARADMDVVAVCRAQIVPVLAAYIAKHDVHKPDIWAARAVTLPSAVGLTPVKVGIWDSGFDRTLFAGKLMTDAKGRPVKGPAFDVEARPATYDLLPLTPEQARLYPSVVADEQGVSDLQNGVDSPAAEAFRKKVATLSPAQAQAFFELISAIGAYSHGTHVTGIAAAGNPAIRLTSAVMTYDTKPVPTPPTDELQARLRDSYVTIAEWFEAHGVRVVNMSFGVRPSDYEGVLEKNGIGKDAAERKMLARHYYEYEREGFITAFKSAPHVLFVAAAMNNDSDNAFDQSLPSSLEASNLVTVGAVDQAGGRTGFTSTGKNVRIYASGYNVESVVPGGAHVQESGTSMAAPQVSNLAAKLIAIRPDLTPAQTIALIERSSDAGDEPAIRLIDPKNAVAELESRRGARTSAAARQSTLRKWSLRVHPSRDRRPGDRAVGHAYAELTEQSAFSKRRWSKCGFGHAIDDRPERRHRKRALRLGLCEDGALTSRARVLDCDLASPGDLRRAT